MKYFLGITFLFLLLGAGYLLGQTFTAPVFVTNGIKTFLAMTVIAAAEIFVTSLIGHKVDRTNRNDIGMIASFLFLYPGLALSIFGATLASFFVGTPLILFISAACIMGIGCTLYLLMIAYKI